MAPLLLRSLASSLFVFADKSFINLSKKYKLLEIIHTLLISSFLFFLRLLPSFFSSIHLVPDDRFPLKSSKAHIPVSSRKYEVVRSLAEKLIDENHWEGIEELREVNRKVFSTAFNRTIGQIESRMLDLGFFQDDDDEGCGGGSVNGPAEFRLGQIVRAVRFLGESAYSRLGRVKEGANQTRISAEKLAAEALWLAEKMASCGCRSEACRRWASAGQLGRLSLAVEL
ncbi:uncharacterized protein LOC111483193 [Cucurbita maxima]|uniref:Uncharacterized protein LOC111483193 n=1 Tax=Cucurbita maxima TaxID=3661 RepID=A0A6J1J3Z3_CUCMA|nr:uncharacterized protein LOC111483193 [Cucurbita maxima]